MLVKVISAVVFYVLVSIIFGNGIYQLFSKEPVGFYSDNQAPSVEQLTDMHAWNKRHGIMWIIHGFCTLIGWVCGIMIFDGFMVLIPFAIGLLVPIIFMVIYHKILISRYVFMLK